MTDKTLACADYFRSHPGYHRILAALRQKFQRYGRATGTIRLQDASPEECEAARLLLGRPFSPPLQLQAAQIEAALQETRFQGVCLKAVLEAYFGEAIKTSKETRADLDSCVSALLEQTAAAVSGNTSRRWLQALAEDQGGSLFRREAARDPSGAGSGTADHAPFGDAGFFDDGQQVHLCGRRSRQDHDLLHDRADDGAGRA